MSSTSKFLMLYLYSLSSVYTSIQRGSSILYIFVGRNKWTSQEWHLQLVNGSLYSGCCVTLCQLVCRCLNIHELTATLMILPWSLWIDPSWLTLTLMSWPQLLSDFDVVLECCYHFIVVVLITTTVVNVPWSWSSVKSLNLHKFM